MEGVKSREVGTAVWVWGGVGAGCRAQAEEGVVERWHCDWLVVDLEGGDEVAYRCIGRRGGCDIDYREAGARCCELLEVL